MRRPAHYKNVLRGTLAVALGGGLIAFFLLGGRRMLSFEELVAHKDQLIGQAAAQGVWAQLLFLVLYLALGLCALPGSTLLTVMAGMVFGFRQGLMLVILGNTLASSAAFFWFRYLLRDWVLPLVGRRYPALAAGLQREGVFLVFAFRLVPVVPFSITNVVLAVSPVAFGTYFWVTIAALLPRFILYVYAGTQVGVIQDPDDILSPYLIAALVVLAVLPWLLKGIMRSWKERRGRKTGVGW